MLVCDQLMRDVIGVEMATRCAKVMTRHAETLASRHPRLGKRALYSLAGVTLDLVCAELQLGLHGHDSSILLALTGSRPTGVKLVTKALRLAHMGVGRG